MSAHELTVLWPAYLEARSELQRIQEQLKDTQSPEQFDQEIQTMGGGA